MHNLLRCFAIVHVIMGWQNGISLSLSLFFSIYYLEKTWQDANRWCFPAFYFYLITIILFLPWKMCWDASLTSTPNGVKCRSSDLGFTFPILYFLLFIFFFLFFFFFLSLFYLEKRVRMQLAHIHSNGVKWSGSSSAAIWTPFLCLISFFSSFFLLFFFYLEKRVRMQIA